MVHSPREAKADQAAAQAAATQAGALRSLSIVDLPADVVGLDKPAYTITLTFSGTDVHKLLIGAETPVGDGYYARVDGGGIQVIDKIGLDALLGLLTAPPYPATPTPPASDAPSTATGEATESPVGVSPVPAATTSP